MVDNLRAAYRVLDPNGFYSDNDHLYAEGEEIYYEGTPNDQLEPLNEVAQKRLEIYLEMLDDLAKKAAEKLGRPYVGRPRNLDGGLMLATELQRSGISIMGLKNKETNTERVSKGQTPETGSVTPKRGRGRPRLVA